MLLEDEIGSPQPPEMSLGVMRTGGLPNSTFGGAGFAGEGSGAPQGLLSFPDPHGSKVDVLLGNPAGDLNAWAAGLGAGAVIVGVDRLNAELKFALLGGGAETVEDAGLGGEAGVELAKPPKSSAANKSVGMDVGAGLGAGAACGAGAL